MNGWTKRQVEFWDKEAEIFDAIYSHDKNRLGVFLDSVFRWDMYERYNYTIHNAEPIRNRTFLDVGCGTGRYLLEFARRGASRVVGLDISQEMINICKERARNEKLNNCVLLIKTDILEYESKSSFDVCIGIGVFDYIRDPLAVLTKMRKCIRDRAIMSFPKFWTWRAPIRKVRLALKGGNVYFYTLKDIDKLIKTAGFSRYNLRKIGKLYCVTAFVS